MEKVLNFLQDELEKEYRPPPGKLTKESTLLINDLEKCKTYDNCKAIDKIIEKAKLEYYHDVLSTEPFPLIILNNELLDLGLVEISNKVKNGYYDAE